MEKGYNSVKGPDTEVVVATLNKGLSELEQLSYPGLRFLNDRQILKEVIDASKKDFDAILITCYLDPALMAARQMVSVPVVGMSEASMHLASLMGNSFAIVTSDPAYIPEMEENIKKYGMVEQAVCQRPVRSTPFSSAEFMNYLLGDHTPLLDSFKKIAADFIEDGADVVIAGCGLLSAILTHNGITEIDGVPVMDPVLTGIKFAEFMAGIKKSGLPFISRKLLYSKPSDQEIGDVLSRCFS